MRIDSVRLEGFRNYLDEKVNFSPGINIITGENAQGKTNLLEAVYLLSCGHGFRTRIDNEMIGFTRNHARLQGLVFSGEREQSIDISMGRGQRKRILTNGVKKTAAELSETLRVVLFCPDDLNMIKDGARERRRFMDVAIAQLRPAYGALLSEHSRLYEHKKRILADWREKPSLLDMLDEFSDGLCRCAAQMIRYRAAFVKRLAETAGEIHSEFSGNGETLRLSYHTVRTVTDAFAPASRIYEELLEHQKGHREAELASGSVLSGIQKDDMEIEINGQNARLYASQGQTRTAALSLKMAEREISMEDTGDCPVLLLDDVLSELDAKRQEFVLNRIRGGQTLITCCDGICIRDRTIGRVISIRNGTISEHVPGR